MNFTDEVKKYVREKIFFSIPLLQKKFKCDYLTAHGVVDDLVERGEAVFDGGNSYRYLCGPGLRARSDKDKDFCGIDPKLFITALKKCIERDECSISSLRRVSCSDLSTACSLLNAFVEKGYVSQAQGAKKREILISKQRFYFIYGAMLAKIEEEEQKSEDDDLDERLDEITKIIAEEDRKEVIKRLAAALKNIAQKKSGT